jgi:GT2 family glycosyltransferase
MRQPGVTLSVVSHGQRDLVRRLLRDLHRLQPSALRRVILTLNVQEAEPVMPALAGCDVLVLRNSQPLGFGANHNQAFRHCETEWFAVLNPDLGIEVDFVGRLLLVAGPKDGLLAPQILEVDGTPADAVRRLVTPARALRRRFGRFGDVQSDRQPAVYDWIAGMCLLLRSQAFEAVGGFDPRFFMYCEDADLCLRLQLEGWQIRRIEDVPVIHAAQRASRRSARHLGWHVASLVKHWSSAAYWRYWRRRQEFRASRTAASTVAVQVPTGEQTV